MKAYPDSCIDLTVTSPPYDDLRSYKGYDFPFEDIAKELYRVTKDGGVVVWVVGDKTHKGSETLTSFKQALYFSTIGFNVHDTMIYKKNNPMPLNHNRYEQEFEYMFIFSKGKPSTFNPIKVDCKTVGQSYDFSKRKSATSQEKNSAGRNRDEIFTTKPTKNKGNIWAYSVGINQSTKDRIAFEHPAIFPEKLAHDHIVSWSNEGDLVFDPMCGSGTTLKMAKLLNRNYIGIDISDEYIEIANERLKIAE